MWLLSVPIIMASNTRFLTVPAEATEDETEAAIQSAIPAQDREAASLLVILKSFEQPTYGEAPRVASWHWSGASAN